ncbi:MAG: phosphate ABC transporter substrate-binding protein PstS, partial [Gemmatimonas sp.]
MRSRQRFATFCFVAATAVSACSSSSDRSGVVESTKAVAAVTTVDLTGAGATFPYPLYVRWFNEFAARSDIRINYRSIGSRAGVDELIAGKVDFGATDVPMTDAELASATAPIIHVPTVLGAVALTYNLPSVKRPLRLTGELLADIFLGRVTRWSDPDIAALNPGVALPADSIRVVHRDDGSGTTFILTDYLSSVSTRWSTVGGRGKNVTWPVGTGVSGSEGVVAAVKTTPGALGYLEVVYARQNRIAIAHLRNHAGKFVSPMPFEIASAAAGAASTGALGGIAGASSGGAAHALDMRTSIVDAPGEHAYPLTSFTWIVFSPSTLGAARSRQLTDFM